MDVFYCYSLKLRDHLTKHGCRYFLCALNPNNKRMFWAYCRSDELDAAIDLWDSAKNQS